MSIVDRMLNTFNLVRMDNKERELYIRVMDKLIPRSVVGPLIDDGRIFRSLREILGSSMGIVPRPYMQSVWVHACIRTIATNMMRVPFILKVDAGEALEPDKIEKGLLYDLFQNPNPFMTLEQLIEATFIFFELRGEAFWVLDGREDSSKIPNEIWTFDPMRFTPMQDKKTGFLLGWEYKTGKDTTVFSVNEVIQFKMYNPYNDLRGLAPLEAAKLSVEQDYAASVYNRMFFENGAVASIYIEVPEELGDDAYNRMVKQFEERHKGAKKAHKTAIVEGGAKIREGRLNQRDMEFLGGKNMTAKEIMAVYKVNEVVLGNYTNIKSYEGIKAAHKAFWEECLMPKIVYFEGVLWAKFFSRIGQRRGKGRIWGTFDLANVGPLQVNYKDKVDTAHIMAMMGYPINDINKRLELGMKEVPWGNEWWVPGGFLSVSQTLSGNVPTNNAPQKPPSKTPTGKPLPGTGKEFEATTYIPASYIMKMLENKEPDVIIDVEAITKSVEASKQQEKIENYNSQKLPLRKEFKSKIERFLFDMRKDALEVVSDAKPWSSLYQDERYARLQTGLSVVYHSTIQAGRFSIAKSELGVENMIDALEGVLITREQDVFVSTKADYVTGNFKEIITNLLGALEKYKNNNGDNTEVLKEKTREIFNYLKSKSVVVIKNEIDSAFAYGQSMMVARITGQLKDSLQIAQEEE